MSSSSSRGRGAGSAWKRTRPSGSSAWTPAHGYLAQLLLLHLGDAPSALPQAERQLEIASRSCEQDPENRDSSRDLAAANALAGLALAANGALEDECVRARSGGVARSSSIPSPCSLIRDFTIKRFLN